MYRPGAINGTVLSIIDNEVTVQERRTEAIFTMSVLVARKGFGVQP